MQHSRYTFAGPNFILMLRIKIERDLSLVSLYVGWLVEKFPAAPQPLQTEVTQ